MNIGISTCSLETGGGNMSGLLKGILDAGFDTVEIDAHHYHAFPHGDQGFITRLADTVSSLGMRVNSIHTPFHHSISSPDFSVRDKGVDDIIQLMENSRPLADSLQLKPFLVIHPGHHLTDTPAHDQAKFCRESLEKILKAPAASSYRPCIENMLSSHYGGKASELKEVVDGLGRDRLGICLDTSHSVYDSTPEGFLEDVFNYLETTHISDNFNQSTGEFHAPPMALRYSRVDWPAFLRNIAHRLDTLILEVIRPPFLDNDIFLKMARLSAEQMRRYL